MNGLGVKFKYFSLTCLPVSPELNVNLLCFYQSGIPGHLKSAPDVRRAVVLPLCCVDQKSFEVRIQLARMNYSSTCRIVCVY